MTALRFHETSYSSSTPFDKAFYRSPDGKVISRQPRVFPLLLGEDLDVTYVPRFEVPAFGGSGADQCFLPTLLLVARCNMDCLGWTRILCVQVRRHSIRDGLGAVLGGVLTYYFWCLKCVSDLTVLTGNFQNDSMVASECCLMAA